MLVLLETRHFDRLPEDDLRPRGRDDEFRELPSRRCRQSAAAVAVERTAALAAALDAVIGASKR
jgi:hypothetical protein